MATGPIETHLHRSFNWENAAPGPREGPRGRSARCGNGLFAQCVRLRSEINQFVGASQAKVSKTIGKTAAKPPFTALSTKSRGGSAGCWGYPCGVQSIQLPACGCFGSIRATGRPCPQRNRGAALRRGRRESGFRKRGPGSKRSTGCLLPPGCRTGRPDCRRALERPTQRQG